MSFFFFFFDLFLSYPATGGLDLSEMQLPQLATTESVPDLSSMLVFYFLSSIFFILILVPKMRRVTEILFLLQYRQNVLHFLHLSWHRHSLVEITRM